MRRPARERMAHPASDRGRDRRGIGAAAAHPPRGMDAPAGGARHRAVELAPQLLVMAVILGLTVLGRFDRGGLTGYRAPCWASSPREPRWR